MISQSPLLAVPLRTGTFRSCLVALVSLALLSGCGGGGGSNSTSSATGGSSSGISSGSSGGSSGSIIHTAPYIAPSNASGTSGGTISVSPLSIAVSAFTRQPGPGVRNFGVSFSGLQVGNTYYVEGQYSLHGISTIVGGPNLYDIQFKDPTALGAGVYTDSIQVKGCIDEACTQQLGNSPQTIQVTYTVTASTAQLNSISPATSVAGSQTFTATITGSHFTQQSEVSWNGTGLDAFYVNDTQLTVQVPSGLIATPGTSPVYVYDPTTGTSNTVSYTVTSSSTQLSSLSPGSVVASGPLFLLSVNGSQFSPQSTVLWNGSPRSTTYVSTSRLVARISAADIATAGSVPVTVSDPVNGTPNPLSFTVSPASLTLQSLSPGSVAAGGSAFGLTVLGSGFTSQSVVQWNGSARPTTSISSSGTYELIAQISAADIATISSAQITVQDSGGSGTVTAPLTLSIAAPSKDAVAYQINPAHSGTVNFSSLSLPTTPAWTTDVGGTPAYSLIVKGTVYVTAGLSDGTSNLFALNGSTGATIWGPVHLSGAANAAYDSGHLFVAVYSGAASASLEALDAQTGTVLWSTPLNLSEGYVGAPTAANGSVFLGDVAIDEATGAILWQGGYINTATDAVTPDGVYQAYSCDTQMQRPATGEMIWNEPCSPNIIGGGSGVAVATNLNVYAQTAYPGVESSSIYNAETGTSNGTYLSDVPIVAGATTNYYVQGGAWQYGSFSGATLSAVRQSDSTVLWTFTGDGELVTSPILINQYLFIGSTSGNIYALDATTGQQLWQYSLGGVIPQGARWGTATVLSGLSAGDGLLVVPNGTKITAFVVSTNP